jgi:hypothetical protein
MIGAPASSVGRIFCGKPVSAFPKNAPRSVTAGNAGDKILLA